MAEVKLNRILAFAALVLSVCVCVHGQSITGQGASGSLAGRLTDLHSAPLAGVELVLRNEATGAATRTTTAHNGTFRAGQLAPGLYTVEAENEELGRGQLTGILVQAGQEARIQAAMVFEPLPPKPLVIAHHDIPTQAVYLAFEYPLNRLELLRATPVLMPAFVHDPPPTQSITFAFAFPTAPLHLLPPTYVLLPAFVHDPPATEAAQLRAEVSSLLLPLANLTKLPLIDADQPAQKPQPATQPQTAAQLQTATTEPPAPAVIQPVNTVMAPRLFRDEACEKDGARCSSLSAVAIAGTIIAQLTGAELQQLPVSGRRWEEFAQIAPGASPSAAGGGAQMRDQGQAEADTTIDGMSTRLAFGTPGGHGRGSAGQTEGEPEGMGSAFAGGRGTGVSEAAIRSFQTAAGNAEASASRAAGGRVQLTTLRGQNGLHGQAFLYERQNMLGAQNPFTQWTRETAFGTSTTLPTFASVPYTPNDHESTFGVGVGRQLRRDRLFWFAALESTQRDHPGVSVLKHPDLFFAQPTDDQMQLLGAQLGSGSLAFPRYGQMLETLGGLLGPASRTTTQWLGFGRVDWDFRERHRITVEANAALYDSPGGGLQRVSEAYGTHSFGSSQASEQWLLGRWEAFLTPNLLSVSQLSWSHAILSAHAQTPSAYESTLNINNWNNWGQLPQIVVDSRYGFTIGNPARFGAGSYPDETQLYLQQAANWAHGNLLVKAGLELDHSADATSLLRNQTGTYHYASVENFATDAMAFANYGIAGSLNPLDQHNCDQTGKAWRDSAGVLRGLGYLPCYSYYTQTMGPAGWRASTNETALYVTAQWQPVKYAVFSAGLRWEREQLPAPIAAVSNPALLLTGQTPALGNNWGPRLSLAVGSQDKRWPVLRLGYGIYYGRMMTSTLLTVLSHTGSFNGDLSFYLRPTDNLNQGGAPPFPYVFNGEPLSVVKPGAVEFAPSFRNAEVHQATVGVEQKLPLHVEVTAAAMVSLARHLPVTTDTNIDPLTPQQIIKYDVCEPTPSVACGHTGSGPIKAAQIILPFYASWPSTSGGSGRLNSNYQQVVEMESRANSTYEAATIRINRSASPGLTVHAHYTYAHAMDWNPNESLRLTGGSVLEPDNFSLEYGTSDLDVRHTAMAMVLYETPWKLRGMAGRLANGWALSGVGHFRSGMPYTIRTGGTLSKFFDAATGTPVVALGEGINGSGGDNRIYGLGSDGINYNLGRNTYRYPLAWKADLRLAKRVNFSARRQLEVLVESFNLFNHQNVTEIETTGYMIESGTITGGPPKLNFLTGLKANSVAFGQPFNVNATNFYQPRRIELGVRLRF
jgi:hypothetical protein